MQAELLQVFDEDAALGLDDGLGQAGRAGGVEHPQGVVEGHLFEGGFDVGAGQGGPVEGAFGGFGAEEGMWTTARRVGSSRRSSATMSRRSCSLPP